MAARPPNTSGPSTAVTMALKWNSGSGVHTTSSAVRSQQMPIWRVRASW